MMDQEKFICQNQKNGGELRAQIVTEKEFKYYKEQSALNKENQLAILAMRKKIGNLTHESMMRKNETNGFDMQRGNNNKQKLGNIHSEARKRAMHLSERAYNLKLEQEEEIQKCNTFILETKCRAVRDAQIAEKNIIKQELMEEDEHMNQMMIDKMKLSIEMEAEKEEKEIMRRQHFAEELRKQIFENQENRLVEIQRKREESRLINNLEIHRQTDEISKLKAREIENANIRKSLAENYDQLKQFKDIEREEEKVMDMRVEEYQRMKKKRDDEIIAKRRLMRLQREHQKEGVALKVQNAQKLKIQFEEFNAARIQDEVEREWRRKEKEEALRIAKNEVILKIAREEQIKEKRIMEALEMKRDEEQYKKIIALQKEAMKHETDKKDEKYKKAKHHRSEILKQVNERELGRILERQKKFQEGLSMRKEAEMRKNKLREVMERKCDEMRKMGVPESYIQKVINMEEKMK